MSDIMEGVRILEVAEHTFVPAASAILADWGAEVIKVEHPERGDAMRGLASSGVMPSMGAVHVLLEHSNRGKKSIGIDVSTEKGLDLIYRLAATCDVFLTNKVPAVRKTTCPLGHDAMALLISSALAPGASVLQIVVRFGIPSGIPALDQSAARSGFRMPLQPWASRSPGRPRQAMQIAAADGLMSLLFLALFMALS